MMADFEAQGIAVDVVIPTYNRGEFLRQCLDSVYQEVPVHEVIIVDGGSTDDTVEIAREYPRVQIFIRPDLNLGQARQFGIEQVGTEWFCFIDSDVVLRDGWFDEMWKFTDQYQAIEGNFYTHHVFAFKRPQHELRGITVTTLIRTECVKGIDIPSQVTRRRRRKLLGDRPVSFEDTYIKRHVEQQGFTWYKTNEFLADHYSGLRDELTLTMQPRDLGHYVDSGYVHGALGFITPGAALKRLPKALVRSIRDASRGLAAELHFIYGYFKGRCARRR
jgi:glycosyltransferase involved in cell wall biosynthesis